MKTKRCVRCGRSRVPTKFYANQTICVDCYHLRKHPPRHDGAHKGHITGIGQNSERVGPACVARTRDRDCRFYLDCLDKVCRDRKTRNGSHVCPDVCDRFVPVETHAETVTASSFSSPEDRPW